MAQNNVKSHIMSNAPNTPLKLNLTSYIVKAHQCKVNNTTHWVYSAVSASFWLEYSIICCMCIVMMFFWTQACILYPDKTDFFTACLITWCYDKTSTFVSVLPHNVCYHVTIYNHISSTSSHSVSDTWCLCNNACSSPSEFQIPLNEVLNEKFAKAPINKMHTRCTHKLKYNLFIQHIQVLYNLYVEKPHIITKHPQRVSSCLVSDDRGYPRLNTSLLRFLTFPG